MSALLLVVISHSSQPALTLAGSAGAAAQAAGAEEVRGNICCCARFKWALWCGGVAELVCVDVCVELL
jgi:hypothetical protein